MLSRFLALLFVVYTCQGHAADRPNILFCIADDWGWPHASIYENDPVVQTPAFDRVAREGVLFEQAFVSSPSCTPSRNAILTGQWHWRLGAGANLYGSLPQTVETYGRLLGKAGYHTGSWRKSFGPGQLTGKFKEEHPAGKVYRKGFDEFLAARPHKDTPFCFWLGASDPHRGYKKGSGKESGMDLSKIKAFSFFPDNETVRSDIADYYFEVQRFDSDVAKAISKLEEIGELDNTIIVITGDHGMPFPRCKSNLYDAGTRVPLALRWGKKVKGGQVKKGIVSLVDLAPTFLAAAGLEIPSGMNGRNLLPSLIGDKKLQNWVIFGKERHVPSQEAPSMAGYPSRAYRDQSYLFIRNYRPELWPNGTPNWEKATLKGTWYGDTDNGPTKTVIADLPPESKFYQWSFAKRPKYELYDLKNDPDQLKNLAHENPAITKQYDQLLTEALIKADDPRHIGESFDWNTLPYSGGGPKWKDRGK